MSRGKTLTSLLIEFRAKARISLNPAHNAQLHDAQVKTLQDIQEWLWEDFAWPHLRVERYIDIQAGEYLYSLDDVKNIEGETTGDLSIDRIEKVEVRFNNRWVTLEPGIGPEQYRIWDTYSDMRSWPVRRWRIFEGEQVEVWPRPQANTDATTFEGRIKITGIRKLRPLVAGEDVADLDHRLIVGYATADYLASQGAKDAQLKLQQANKLYSRLRSDLTPRATFRMFGVGTNPKPRLLRGPPTIYYRPSDSGG